MDGTRFIAPAKDLSALVWVYVVRDESLQGRDSLAINHFPGVVYPSLSLLLQGSVELARDNGPQPLPGLFFSGAMTRAIASTNRGSVLSLSVLFRPGVIPHFSAERPSSLVDTLVGAEELWPREAAALRSRAVGMSVEAAFPFVEDFLRQVVRSPRRYGGFQENYRSGITQALSRLTIGEVVARSGLSLRQFERRFMAQYGMTPKLFQRLRRFERTLFFLRDEEPHLGTGLAAVAAECGYFDQSHLTKDFRRFGGKSPSLLLSHVECEEDYWSYRLRLSREATL